MSTNRAPGDPAIRILLVDDHAVLRAGIRSLVDLEDDMEVVAEAGDAAEALEKALATRPDVAVVDLALPGASGVRLMRELRERLPELKLLALTGLDDASHARSVLDAGGAGYVVKSASPDELLTAIRTVWAGRSFIGLSLHETEDDSSFRIPYGAPRLSPREREVLKLVALGHTNDEVGKKLRISGKTVATYRARLMEKLDFESRAELVRYAVASGLLDEGINTD